MSNRNEPAGKRPWKGFLDPAQPLGNAVRLSAFNAASLLHNSIMQAYLTESDSERTLSSASSTTSKCIYSPSIGHFIPFGNSWPLSTRQPYKWPHHSVRLASFDSAIQLDSFCSSECQCTKRVLDHKRHQMAFIDALAVPSDGSVPMTSVPLYSLIGGNAAASAWDGNKPESGRPDTVTNEYCEWQCMQSMSTHWQWA